MQTTLSPYLNFNGNCKEAMEFYQSVLGGTLDIQNFDDNKDRVVHATLTNDILSFMASDGPVENKVVFGDNIHMSLASTDETRLRKYFNDLYDGGTIDMALAKQFWGDTFGMLTDKFGIHWMVNISSR